MGTLQAHIRLDVSLNIPYALLPGDPARIDHIARHLENVTELAYNREFRSISGTYKGVQVLAVSTGIGGASMGIALEELHGCGVQCAIRIGSCGALQHDIAPGQLVLAEGAVREDGESAAYLPLSYPDVADHRLLASCCKEAREQALGISSLPFVAETSRLSVRRRVRTIFPFAACMRQLDAERESPVILPFVAEISSVVRERVSSPVAPFKERSVSFCTVDGTWKENTSFW